MPPSLRDWLLEDHLAFFVSDFVDRADLAPFLLHTRGMGAAIDPIILP